MGALGSGLLGLERGEPLGISGPDIATEERVGAGLVDEQKRDGSKSTRGAITCRALLLFLFFLVFGFWFLVFGFSFGVRDDLFRVKAKNKQQTNKQTTQLKFISLPSCVVCVGGGGV